MKKATKIRRRNRGLPSRLHLGEPIDARGDVAVLAGLGLELQTYGERARHFADRFERVGELVEQRVRLVWRRRGRFGGALEPVDRLRQQLAVSVDTAQLGRGVEADARSARGVLQR